MSDILDEFKLAREFLEQRQPFMVAIWCVDTDPMNDLHLEVYLKQKVPLFFQGGFSSYWSPFHYWNSQEATDEQREIAKKFKWPISKPGYWMQMSRGEAIKITWPPIKLEGATDPKNIVTNTQEG